MQIRNRPVVSRGARGPENRGKLSGSGNPLAIADLVQIQPPSAFVPVDSAHITLQSAKQGAIVQLTAPADRENPRTGVKIKAKPLVLSFAAGSGFVRLDLRKEEDRRRWIYVVGTEQALADFEGLGITHKAHIDDGDDPIPAHPRYGFGIKSGFWRTDEAIKVAATARRKSVLDLIAKDPQLEAFLKNTSPEELDQILAKRRAKLDAKAKAEPGAVIRDDEDEEEVGAEAEAEEEAAEVEADEEAEAEEAPAPKKKTAPKKKSR